jgi:hypothetical protein
VDDFAGLIALSATPRSWHIVEFYTRAGARSAGIRRQKRIREINDAGCSFDPRSTAKCRPFRRIARRAAAVRRHAVCSAGAQGNIIRQIK